jgi:hypothetical protein
VQAKTALAGFSHKETMFVAKLSGMLPFLALGALGVANLAAPIGALRGTRRAQELGEGRFELLRISTSGSSCCARSTGCC